MDSLYHSSEKSIYTSMNSSRYNKKIFLYNNLRPDKEIQHLRKCMCKKIEDNVEVRRIMTLYSPDVGTRPQVALRPANVVLSLSFVDLVLNFTYVSTPSQYQLVIDTTVLQISSTNWSCAHRDELSLEIRNSKDSIIIELVLRINFNQSNSNYEKGHLSFSNLYLLLAIHVESILCRSLKCFILFHWAERIQKTWSKFNREVKFNNRTSESTCCQHIGVRLIAESEW